MLRFGIVKMDFPSALSLTVYFKKTKKTARIRQRKAAM